MWIGARILSFTQTFFCVNIDISKIEFKIRFDCRWWLCSLLHTKNKHTKKMYCYCLSFAFYEIFANRTLITLVFACLCYCRYFILFLFFIYKNLHKFCLYFGDGELFCVRCLHCIGLEQLMITIINIFL